MLTEHTLSLALEDLVLAEVRALRRADLAPELLPLDRTAPLNGDEIGLKSSELTAAAIAVADRFGLRRQGLEDYLLRRRNILDWAQLCLQYGLAGNGDIVFATSGSTGAPKLCTHPLARLEQEVAACTPLFQDARRIRLLVPAHHIYGFLWGVLLSGLLDVPVYTRHQPPLPFENGDLIITHPAHWGFLAQRSHTFPAGVIGLSSTAPLSDTVKQSLIDLRLSRLVELYGSSETAGIGWRDTIGAPFSLMQRWQRSGDETDRLYCTFSQTDLDLPDHLDFISQRSFHVTGRRDGAVQVQGLNVFPGKIRQHLETHEKVAQARVRKAEETDALIALIVPKAQTPLNCQQAHQNLRIELDHWCRSTLPAVERPLRFHISADIPVTEFGKECAWPSCL